MAALLFACASASASVSAAWLQAGPPILHEPLAQSPQLGNDPPWRASPILISGAAAYRDGEYLYQDYLYDDRGAGSAPGGNAFPSGTYTYPTDPVYGDNAADIVEVRMKLLRRALAVRITFNTMHNPSLVAATIALGGTPGVTYPMPHDAGAREPAQVFVTVHGHSGDIVDATTGRTLSVAPTVFPTLFRRQLDVRIPYSAFDPRWKAFRVAVASGLWDVANGAYLQPGTTATATTPGGDGTGPTGTTQIPAIVNVAFRFNEPQVYTNPWRENAQAAALTAGDLSPFYAMVDPRKLAAGVTDNMLDQPDGTPTVGYLDRIMVSHFEDQQGRGAPIATIQQIITNTVPIGCGGNPCELSGRLEPYMVYVPSGPAPKHGWGITLDLHNCNQTYNVRTGTAAVTVFGDRRPGRSLVLTPEARGSCYWYYSEPGADVFEAWADVAAHYPVNEREADITGTSMGGYGVYKFASLYPDLFARASTLVGCVSAGVLWSGEPTTPPGGQGSLIYPMLASLRNLPIMSWNGSADSLCVYGDQQPVGQTLDGLGYRYSFWTFTGAGHTNLSPDRTPMADLFGNARVDPNPAHITYVVNQSMSEPAYGLTTDHAYWISNIRLRNASISPPEGTVDVRSEGFGVGDPPAFPTATTTGELPPATSDNSQLPVYPYVEQSKSWGTPPVATPADVLDINATNIASMAIDVSRAHVDCHAHLNVTSDGPISIHLLGCPR
ncbi:MAG: alpha/beta hydrolase-fold protein [Solirubrobacteraceae bacterium]